jgi:hypothetical protein
MTADIVVGGLGGDGPIVTNGLGLTGAPDPNAMRAVLRGTSTITAELTAAGGNALAATLNGSGTLTATLTDANAPEVPAGKPGGRRFWGASLTPPPIPVTVGHMSAVLVGTSALTADLDFTIDFDDELQQLMLLGAV